MTMDECIAVVDAKLPKPDQELNPRDMFKACDLLITRPDKGP